MRPGLPAGSRHGKGRTSCPPRPPPPAPAPPAQTVYPLMGIAANVALVLAGSWVKFVNSHLVPAAGGSTQVGARAAPRLQLLLQLDPAGGLLCPRCGTTLGLLLGTPPHARRHGVGPTPGGVPRLPPEQVMLNFLVGGIVCLTGVMMAAKFALDK